MVGGDLWEKPANIVFGADRREVICKCQRLSAAAQLGRYAKVSVEMLHIAYGLVAKLDAGSEIYYLKFASRSMHDNPDQLFPWLQYARKQGIPLPEIIPATNGSWYLSPKSECGIRL